MPENLHAVEWNDQKIGAFWDNINYLIMKDVRTNKSFAFLDGKDLVRVVGKHLQFENKTVMDYGCGLGFFSEEIMKQYNPAAVYACDLASESVKKTIDRCKGYGSFKGAYLIDDNQLPLEEGTFDIVVVLEIVEHLSEEALDFLLKQVNRLLRVGGVLVVTTPNEENLKNNIQVCPDCGCYFHSVQHVRSWSDKTLMSYVNKYGFKENKTIKTTLCERNSFKGNMISLVKKSLFPIIGKKPEHLIYIAEKT